MLQSEVRLNEMGEDDGGFVMNLAGLDDTGDDGYREKKGNPRRRQVLKPARTGREGMARRARGRQGGGGGGARGEAGAT